MKVVCENRNSCGVLSQSTKVGKKEVVTYSCGHAVEHEFTSNCKNTTCKRCWPNRSKCVEPVVVVDESAVIADEEVRAEIIADEMAIERSDEATVEVAMEEATAEVMNDEAASEKQGEAEYKAELAKEC